MGLVVIKNTGENIQSQYASPRAIRWEYQFTEEELYSEYNAPS